MIIYNYSKNGVYTGSKKARSNPLVEEAFLVPANATVIKPPDVTENEITLFKNGAWVVYSSVLKHYSIAGWTKSKKYRDWEDHGEGLLMPGENPSPTACRCSDGGDGTGTWVEDADIVAAEAAIVAATAYQEVKNEELVNGAMANLTMDEAETYIENSVTDLSSAKIALKRIVRLILART